MCYDDDDDDVEDNLSRYLNIKGWVDSKSLKKLRWCVEMSCYLGDDLDLKNVFKREWMKVVFFFFFVG